MFANVMNQTEKEKFLELIYKIAQCDDEYSEEEEDLLNNYKIERKRQIESVLLIRKSFSSSRGFPL